MKDRDPLAVLAVALGAVGFGFRPTWVSAAVLVVALAIYAADRVALAYRGFAERQREHSLAVEKYGAEVQELRAEIKLAVDGVKTLASNATMNKRVSF